MTFTLYKMSAPGWKLDFCTEEEARVRLLKHICDQCRTTIGIAEDSSIDQMLGTDCGCEYDVDLLEEDRTSYADVGTHESSEYYVRMKAKEEAIADAIDRVKYIFGAK